MKTSRDLKFAAEAVEAMAKTTNFEEFERYWQDFLFRTERAWEAACQVVSSKGGNQSWVSKYTRLRKKDPLLRYLRQARNAETHVVEPTVSHTFGLSVGDRLGRAFRVDGVKASLENGVLTFDIDTPDGHLEWDAQVIPGDPHLLRFKCRGEWYNPPYEHLGQRIDNLHPVAVARLGVAFYQALINEAEENVR